MAYQQPHSHGFAPNVLRATATGMKYAGTAKAIYDVGRQVYNVARVAAPVVAAML